MTFSDVLDRVREKVRTKGRVTYGALKREFALDDDYLADITAELIDAERVARDEDGKVLVWIGAAPAQRLTPVLSPVEGFQVPSSPQSLTPNAQSPAERRQLTVLFCDLVGSTALSELLDPEELREVVQTYHAMCAEAITRYVGYTAQHLGDGLLVYFGYPTAHEDEAARAVRTSLEILAGLQLLNVRMRPALKARLPHPIQVRIGIHTGLVVIGEIGSSEKRELLALGETPNLAARLQGIAEPDTVVISAATQHLILGLFEYQDLGSQFLKGLSTPVAIYRVVGESATQSRFEAAVSAGLTPLVGREEELGILRQRWAQAKEGAGQVVLLSGEPGIGKSRLVQELKELVSTEGATRIEFRCSPYHQNSALSPIIDHLQRLLQFMREDAPETRLEKLQHMLSRYHFPQADTLPLLATLLSLPQPEGMLPLMLSPQKQKQRTQEALVAWLMEDAEKAAVYCAWEDLHWADPSTLELLTLLLEQAPPTKMLTLLTSRPEFTSPWGNRSHFSQITLSRLGPAQVREMVNHVVEQVSRPSTSSGRTESEPGVEGLSVRAESFDQLRTGSVEAQTALPDALIEAVVAKTDGVPLFVEELTKTVVETIGVQPEAPSLQMGVPSTLQDALMARLDRLGPTKELAQLGATLGREFSYELLHAVSNRDEESLQQGLKQLVEAELMYQRGLAPQAHYLFKHALIQDTAYQSLLKSRRQQLHQQIARVLADRFPGTVEAQPELLAHHYTEAGLAQRAIPSWQQAGQRAVSRSANHEAISHFNKGLELLMTLPATPERTQQELSLQMALGAPLTATKGTAAREVGKAYARARELCQQLGETPQLFPVLRGLWLFYIARAEYQTARELAEQCLRLAQSARDPALLLEAQYILGNTLFYFGEFAPAREHFEQSMALYNFGQHRSHAFLYGQDTGMVCLARLAWTIFFLGYPDQALKLSYQAVTLAKELSHPHSQAYARGSAATFHQLRREEQAAQEQAEAAMTLSTDQGFALWVAWGTMLWGWALAKQERGEEGTSQIRQGMAAFRATGAEVARPYLPALLAEAYERTGHVEEGLSSLAEALAAGDNSGERWYEAELYRLKGQLTLQSQVTSHKSKVEEAEACFLKAIEIAQKQQAKSLELRAAVSLARLWRKQDKKAEAYELLSNVYNWFTEGFDTKDLQEAKVLLEELV